MSGSPISRQYWSDASTPISKQLCSVDLFQSQASGTIAASIYGSPKATSQRLAAAASRYHCSFHLILQLPATSVSRQYCSVRLLLFQGNIAASICCNLEAILQLASTALSRQHCSDHLLQSQGNVAVPSYFSLRAILQRTSVAASMHHCSFHPLQSQGSIYWVSFHFTLKAILQLPSIAISQLPSTCQVVVVHNLSHQFSFRFKLMCWSQVASGIFIDFLNLEVGPMSLTPSTFMFLVFYFLGRLFLIPGFFWVSESAQTQLINFKLLWKLRRIFLSLSFLQLNSLKIKPIPCALTFSLNCAW